jgi:hypothetical protein
MGFFSKLTDDILGLDPGGGGVYGAARDVLGDKIADDVLGMDPSGGGAIKAYNVALPLIAGYYGLEALGGVEGITNMFGSGTGAAGTTFTEAQLAAANASADPIAYLASATPGAGVAGAAAGVGNFMSKYAAPIASVGNALAGAYSSNKAAGVQSDAARYAADLQNQQFQQTRTDLMPYMQAGNTALNRLSTGLGKGGEFDTPFSQSTFTQDPGYAFRLSEGQKALDRQAAARGGLISGSALKAATRFGQDMASQEYNNAFNRYQTERNARLNPLQSLAGVGQTTAQQVGTFGANAASNVGNLNTSAADARASGYMGVANAVGGGLNQYANYQQDQQVNSLLQRVLRNRG